MSHSPIERIKNLARAARTEARVTTGRHRSTSFSNLSEESIIRELLVLLKIPAIGYCVDIAAADGTTMSNTWSLYRSGWAGLAVEYDGARFSTLARRYRSFKDVRLARCMVTPENIRALLLANQTPPDFEFLSLDIDGYDHFVLDELLQDYRPQLICVEINENIPPPIRFTVDWNPNYSWAEDHFYGQSIAKLDELLTKHQYSLVRLNYNNAFLAPSELSPIPSLTPEEAYRTGYLDKPDRKEKFPWNEDMEPLLHMAPEEGLAFVKEYFAQYDGAYTVSL
jgi:hypothetical protein